MVASLVAAIVRSAQSIRHHCRSTNFHDQQQAHTQIIDIDVATKSVKLGTKADGTPVDLTYEAPKQSALGSADASTNTLSLNWGAATAYSVNDVVTSSSTIDISGLAPDTDYKVKSVTGNAITLVAGTTADGAVKHAPRPDSEFQHFSQGQIN